MKVTLSILIFGIICFIDLSFAAKEGGYYKIKYDVNLDEILHSDRLLNNYFKCLVDKGKCTPEAADLKKIIPDALRNRCSKCTNMQKDYTYKVIHYLVRHRPHMWAALEKKYDPEGVFKKLVLTDPAFRLYRPALGI